MTGQSVHMTATAGRSPIEELLLRGGSLPDAARFGAATYFADHRAPRGDRHVRVCTGTGCFIGSRGDGLGLVESALGVAAGGCAADGSVSLQMVHCLGYCYAGPAALDGDAPRAGPDLVDQLAGGPHRPSRKWRWRSRVPRWCYAGSWRGGTVAGLALGPAPGEGGERVRSERSPGPVCEGAAAPVSRRRGSGERSAGRSDLAPGSSWPTATRVTRAPSPTGC